MECIQLGSKELQHGWLNRLNMAERNIGDLGNYKYYLSVTNTGFLDTFSELALRKVELCGVFMAKT